ncbi:MAG: hypothetical protein GC191_13925 [Azospirillum sp.]|nr:hypothetical protein [Azospirillum sp.]
MTETGKPGGNGPDMPLQGDCTAIAELVRAAIHSRGLKQAAVAREAGIDASLLTNPLIFSRLFQ